MSQSSARRTSGRGIQRKTSKKSNTPLIIGAVAAVVVIMVAAGIALSRDGGGVSLNEQQLPNQVPPPGNPHIVSPTDPHPAYNSNPPTSGYHWGGGWAPWGVHQEPIQDMVTVHNLEHGGVIIHYRQDLDKATVDQLVALTRELQRQSPCILLEPRPVDKLDTPVAVTAWTWLLKDQKVDSQTLNSIRSFFRQHVDQGPEKLGCQLR